MARRQKNNNDTFQLRLPKAQKAALKRAAKQQHTSLGTIVRQAIDRCVGEPAPDIPDVPAHDVPAVETTDTQATAPAQESESDAA